MYSFYREKPEELARVLTERSRHLFCALNFNEFGEHSRPTVKDDAGETNRVASLVHADMAQCRSIEDVAAVTDFWIAVIRHRLALQDESSSVSSILAVLESIYHRFPHSLLHMQRGSLNDIRTKHFNFLRDNPQYNTYCRSILNSDFPAENKILNVCPFLSYIVIKMEMVKGRNEELQLQFAAHVASLKQCFTDHQSRVNNLPPFASESELSRFENGLAKLTSPCRIVCFDMSVEFILDTLERALKFRDEPLNIILVCQSNIPYLDRLIRNFCGVLEKEKNYRLCVEITLDDTTTPMNISNVLQALKRSLFTLWNPRNAADVSLLVTSEPSLSHLFQESQIDDSSLPSKPSSEFQYILLDLLNTSPHTKKFNRIRDMGVHRFLVGRELGITLTELELSVRQQHENSADTVATIGEPPTVLKFGQS